MIDPLVLARANRLFCRVPMRELRLVDEAAATSGPATLTCQPGRSRRREHATPGRSSLVRRAPRRHAASAISIA
jgi:hypothetical protein